MLYKNKVVGAIDPNELTVFPAGEGEEGYIHEDQPLLYTIEFENIGNYEAENIEVTNELPDNLDISRFSLLQCSHSCHFQLTGRMLKVNFDTIRLPFSKQDPDGSKGFLTFKLSPKHNISPSARVQSQASIQFDFELPINTGKVLNTIYPQSKLSSRNTLFTFPNPTADACTIRAKSYASGIILTEVKGFNAKGELLFNEPVNSVEYTLHLSQYNTAGPYLIIAKDANRNEYTTTIITTR